MNPVNLFNNYFFVFQQIETCCEVLSLLRFIVNPTNCIVKYRAPPSTPENIGKYNFWKSNNLCLDPPTTTLLHIYIKCSYTI